MFGPFHSDRMFWHLWDTARRHGTRDRKGTISHVKEGGGERKIRALVGYTRFGEPVYTPWMHTEENRSGDHRSEEPVKVGQNVSISGYDWSTASASPGPEAEHSPRPPQAGTNRRTRAFGGKMYTTEELPEEGGDGGHMQEAWIADEKEDLPKYKPQEGGVFGTVQGQKQASAASGGQQSQQKQQKPKVRTAMNEKGAGGKHTWSSSIEDGKKHVQVSEDGAFILADGGSYWIKGGELYTTSPPKLAPLGLPIDKFKPKSSGGGGGGSGAMA